MCKQLNNALTVALVISILVGAVSLLSYFWFQLSSGYLHGDALIFQTVGRGMLHGAVPYTDLFETKPPGVFLLHALSWKLAGSQLLVSVFTVLCLLGVAVHTGAPVLGFVADKPAHERRFLCLLSVLFGIVLALYMSDQAGGGLTETYGAYFGIMYLIALITAVKYKYVKPMLLGVLLLMAVGFKEPFILSILAGVILLIDEPGEAFRSMALPIVIAAVLGVAALLILGLFIPFFEAYLPHMLGFHINFYSDSVFLRALEVWRTFINLGAYSWGLAAAMAVLWFATAKLAPVRWFLASYFTLLSIAIGGDFYGHHFVFAVPMFVAMWWVFLRSGEWQVQRGKLATVFIALGLMYAALFDTQFSYASQAESWSKHEAEMIVAAEVIDNVMESCGWEKYLQMIPRVGDTFAYTDHVPYGPIFLHYTRFIGAFESYRQAHFDAWQEAQLALFSDQEIVHLSEQAKQFIRSNFSTISPPCVPIGFIQPDPYTLYFRKIDINKN